MFFLVAEFVSLAGRIGRGFLQTRVPREGWWGPDGVTRDREDEVGVLGGSRIYSFL